MLITTIDTRGHVQILKYINIESEPKYPSSFIPTSLGPFSLNSLGFPNNHQETGCNIMPYKATATTKGITAKRPEQAAATLKLEPEAIWTGEVLPVAAATAVFVALRGSSSLGDSSRGHQAASNMGSSLGSASLE